MLLIPSVLFFIFFLFFGFLQKSLELTLGGHVLRFHYKGLLRISKLVDLDVKNNETSPSF